MPTSAFEAAVLLVTIGPALIAGVAWYVLDVAFARRTPAAPWEALSPRDPLVIPTSQFWLLVGAIAAIVLAASV